MCRSAAGLKWALSSHADVREAVYHGRPRRKTAMAAKDFLAKFGGTELSGAAQVNSHLTAHCKSSKSIVFILLSTIGL